MVRVIQRRFELGLTDRRTVCLHTGKRLTLRASTGEARVSNNINDRQLTRDGGTSASYRNNFREEQLWAGRDRNVPSYFRVHTTTKTCGDCRLAVGDKTGDINDWSAPKLVRTTVCGTLLRRKKE